MSKLDPCSNCHKNKRAPYRSWCAECLKDPKNVVVGLGRFTRALPCAYCCGDRKTLLVDDVGRACCEICQNR